MSKKTRQHLEDLKTECAELKEALKVIRSEINRIAQGGESEWLISDLHKLRDNLKMRIRGFEAAIRDMGPAKFDLNVRRKFGHK
jgi:hypothetical protein